MRKGLMAALIVCISFITKAQTIDTYTADKLMQRVANNDTFYIVNFWATWCAPCVKELPIFSNLEKTYAGKPVKVLLVSVDFKQDVPHKLTAFIKKKKLAQEVVWLNETNANEFIPKIDDRWQGSIPATLLIWGQGGYKNFFEGMVRGPQLHMLIDEQLAMGR